LTSQNTDQKEKAQLDGDKIIPDFDFSGLSEPTSLSEIIELVSPGSIAQYLDTSKENYDVVILDIGSLAESSDARMVSDLADYVVLAVKWGLTSVEQFERSLARGISRTDRSVGAVLTMVPSSTVLEVSTGEKTQHRLAAA
jgi:Mrp family chromosome partitioning ATPase